MKTFTFRYDPHPRKSAKTSISKSLKTGMIDIEPDSISCKSMEDMMKLMTKTRFQIFTAIVEKSPDSMTELADVLEKDLGNLLRDAQVLQSLGLIELQRSAGRRGDKITPVALYQKVIFECEPKRKEQEEAS